MSAPNGPTIRRRRLNARLRQLRADREMTCEQVAQKLGVSASWVSRIEAGKRGVRPGDVRELLAVYGVQGPEVEELVQLARDARTRGWWQAYDDVLSDAMRTFVGLEQDATMVGNYEAHFVPGLLQTEAYTRELFLASRPTMNAEIVERLTQVRMARKQVLDRENPPTLWAIIDEAVLRREVGGRGVMREQLHALLDAGDRANVTLQVVPFTSGAYHPMGTGFHLFEFTESDPPVVYLENLGGGIYLEEPADVARCRDSLNYLRGVALSDKQSAACIAEVVKSL